MLNVDVKRSSDYPHHSDVDHSGDEGGKKELVLPMIKGAYGKLNMSDGNINLEMDDYDHKPKM
jgi:maltooligosyltrehalose synthase